MDNPKRNRRLSIILPSIPILAAAAIAILQNVMSVEPSADIYSVVYPIAGPLLQIVDRYTYHHTLHSAGAEAWIRYISWCAILVFSMFSPAIFFSRSRPIS